MPPANAVSAGATSGPSTRPAVTSSGIALHMRHLVVPGQVIATAGDASGSDGASPGFLRGHGTYIEGAHTVVFGGGGGSTPRHGSGGTETQTMEDEDGDSPSRRGGRDDANATSDDEPDARSSAVDNSNQRLVASVAGVVERVNKLVSVIPAAPMPYDGHVGDLVVGRVSAVQSSRWKINLGPGCRGAALPLSGVNLPGGVQRIRTSEDALEMRRLFAEGDLVSAEVQQVQHGDGSLTLHTRSLRYGKLENGCLVSVPPALVRRMKQHFATLPERAGVDTLLGKNGYIWIQRAVPAEWRESMSGTTAEEVEAPLAETLQKLRRRHAETPVLPDERERLCRVRNSIEALALVYCGVTTDTIMAVFDESVRIGVSPKEMLEPEVVVRVTEPTRQIGQN